MRNDEQWMEEYGERRFLCWAIKGWAGFGDKTRTGEAEARILLRELRSGKVSDGRRGAAAWLLDGGSIDAWTEVCALGYIGPSCFAEVIGDIYGDDERKRAVRWAEGWKTGETEVIPWKGGEIISGETRWVGNARRRERGRNGGEVVWRGGKGMAVRTRAVQRVEAEQWAADLQLPEKLLRDARIGRLCILLGAGASKADPAGLPLYGEIARKVTKIGKDIPDDEIDAALDDARERIPDLNEQMAIAIRKAEEKCDHRPSEVHREAVKLAKMAGTEAIATTNWDTLLQRQWAQESWANREWEEQGWCPWEGENPGERIILLHGAVRDPERMLVTRKDMKSWYEDPQARVVIDRWMAGNSVLTVGYRWGDRVLRKVIGGAQRKSERRNLSVYAIHEQTGVDGEAGWEGGMEGIQYPIGQHEIVPAILRRIQREVTDHPVTTAKKTLQAIAEGGAAIATENDWKVVRAAATDTSGTDLRHFTRVAKPEQWLDERLMREGLGNGLNGGMNEWIWTAWIAQGANTQRIARVAALASEGTRGGRGLAPRAALRLVRELGRDEEGGAKAQGELILWLMERAGRENRYEFLELANRCIRRLVEEGQKGVLQEIWEWAVAPRWVAERRYGEEGERAAGNAVSGTEGAYELERLWQQMHGNILDEDRLEWIEVFAKALERRQQMLDRKKGTTSAWCEACWSRSAIEPHEQDDLPATTVDVCVDALRDLLQELGSAQGSQEPWERTVERCAGSISPLVRRCAVHTVRVSEWWSAEQKLEWVDENGRPVERSSWHERYLLVQEVWKEASCEAKQQHVGRREGPIETNEAEEVTHIERERFDWLTGLARDTGDEGVLCKAAQRSRARNRQWDPRPWSSLLHYWSESVTKGKPRGTEGLATGEEGIQKVLDWEPPSQYWLGDDGQVRGAESEVEEKATTDPGWGSKLAAKLLEKAHTRHWAWPAICRGMKGWPEAEWETAAKAWPWYEITSGDREQEQAIGRLLSERGRATGGEEIRVRTLAKTVLAAWKGMRSRENEDTDGDYPHESINSPDGQALEGLFAAAAKATTKEQEARKSGDKPGAEAGRRGRRVCLETMEEMLGTPRTGGHAKACLAAHGVVNGQWLAYWEPEWVEENIAREMGGNGETAKAIRQSLQYVGYNAGKWVEAIKPGLRRELNREMEEDGEGGSVAKKWAQGILLGSEWWRKEGKGQSEEDWSVAKFPAVRRCRVLEEASRILSMHKNREEQRRMWQNGIKRVWEGICREHGVATREEKEALLQCYRWIGSESQREFEKMFRAGETVNAVRGLIEPGYEVDQSATLRLAEGLEIVEGWTTWEWEKTLEVIQGWVERGYLGEPERSLGKAVLAKHGW